MRVATVWRRSWNVTGFLIMARSTPTSQQVAVTRCSVATAVHKSSSGVAKRCPLAGHAGLRSSERMQYAFGSSRSHCEHGSGNGSSAVFPAR